MRTRPGYSHDLLSLSLSLSLSFQLIKRRLGWTLEIIEHPFVFQRLESGSGLPSSQSARSVQSQTS